MLSQDVGYSIRSLLKSPAVLVVTLLSLAFGIGVNTAIFSLVETVFLRSPAVRDPDRLVAIYSHNPKWYGIPYGPNSYPDYVDFRGHNEVFTGIIAFCARPVPVDTGEQTELIDAEIVSGNYFSELGVKAAIGRTFLPEEDSSPGLHPVTVLSYGFWQHRFGSDPNIVGKTLTVNRFPFTIVGVAPRGFNGMKLYSSPNLWIPLTMRFQVMPTMSGVDPLTRRNLRWFELMGRLKPRITIEQAQAALTTLARQLEQAYPEDNEEWTVRLLPERVARFGPSMRKQVTNSIEVLAAISVFVWLIACSNMANLQLARGTARQKEMAIRMALGANRSRLIRQLLTESLLLSFLGAALGLLVAFLTMDLLLVFQQPLQFPIRLDLRLNRPMLGFTALLAVLTGAVFGLAPQLFVSGVNLSSALKEGMTSRIYHRLSLRNGLVILQVSLSVLLLIIAGLSIKSLRNVWATSPGFDTRNVLLMSFDLYPQGYSETNGKAFYEELLRRVEILPGVQSASLGGVVLPSPVRMPVKVAIKERPSLPFETPLVVDRNIISPDYFRTLGITVLQGRDFNYSDVDSRPPVVVINESMAHRFWPGQNPLGKTMRIEEEDKEFEIVGVVKDAKYGELQEQHRPYLFFSFLQLYTSELTLHVKTANPPLALVPAIRAEVRALKRDLPVYSITTLENYISNGLSKPRAGAALSAAFSFIAVVLSATGIYGIITFFVGRRTREIAICMAIGAQQSHVLKLVVGEGLKLTLAGVALGLATAFAITRLIANQLYQVSFTDPLTFGTASLLMVVVAIVASYLPGRKAVRIDPVEVLRNE